MPYSIMLDAGHGGRDPGAVYKERQEKDDNLKLVMAIGEVLEQNGMNVEYTRTTDVYETPFQKAMEANRAGVDYFVSIHRNSTPIDNSANGVLSLVYNLEGIKYEMAGNINRELTAVGYKDLGIDSRPNLVVLKRTQMPAVLVEVGFLNSDKDNSILDTDFENTVQAIAEGILETVYSEEDAEGETSGKDEGDGEMEDPEGTGSIGDSDGDCRCYWVQTGLFRYWGNAQRLLWELLGDGFPASITDEGSYISVRVGGFDTLEEAVDMEKKLRRAGYETIIVR